MNIFDLQNSVYVLVFFVLLAVKIFAFVNSLLYSAESYEAAGKLTKPAWSLILGLAVLLQLLPIGLFIFNIAFTVAAIVFLVDVRPALAGLRRR
ncbi:hypothetical protein GCM10027020_36720 [Nocardioides salsibiostraticola]